MSGRTEFDRAYYRRFYGYPRISKTDRREADALGDFVCNYLTYLQQPVRRVLDIGCGLGLWQPVIQRHFPKARYTGVEHSDYLCTQFGWIKGSVIDYVSRSPYDLVICDDVLQYLPNRAAVQAFDNLDTLCRGALYINALTAEDWQYNCDGKRTDGDVYLRNARWYRRHLRRRFTDLGGGVFLGSRSPATPWELGKSGQ